MYLPLLWAILPSRLVVNGDTAPFPWPMKTKKEKKEAIE